MHAYNWSRLNHLQIGKYAEYAVMMELTLHGFQVYSSEVDDRGIDFVARYEDGPFYEVQVKATRNLNYVFAQKDKFRLDSHRLLALVILEDSKEPAMYLIPSVAWRMPNALLVDHNYEGKQSKPEWGINLSMRNLPLLGQYSFDKTIHTLIPTDVLPAIGH